MNPTTIHPNQSDSSFETVASQTFVIRTAEEVSEWNSTWTSMTIDEYFDQKEERGNTPSDEVEETYNISHLRYQWEQMYLGSTTIPGRHSMLVDLGSRVNVIGSNTEKKLSSTAKNYGHDTTYVKRNKALLIGGVGEGHARCEYEARYRLQ